MAVEATLQRIDDMIRLNYDNITSKERLDLYRKTESKSFVSNDQIHHIIKSIDQRYLKSSLDCFDTIHNKSKQSLLYHIEKNIDHTKNTITEINKRLTDYHIEFRKKTDSQGLMEKLIDEEYIELRDKYFELMKCSYDQSYNSKKECDNYEKIKFNESINKLREYKDNYIKIPELSMNNDEDIRASIRLSIYGQRLQSKAQSSNLESIDRIQNRLSQTSEFILHQAKEKYDLKLRYPIKSLEERNRLSLWRRRLIFKQEELYYNDLLRIEDEYLDLVEFLSDEVMLLREELQEINNYLSLLRAMKHNLSDSKVNKHIYRLKLGKRLKVFSKYCDMNDEDIFNMLFELYSIIKSRNSDKVTIRY